MSVYLPMGAKNNKNMEGKSSKSLARVSDLGGAAMSHGRLNGSGPGVEGGLRRWRLRRLTKAATADAAAVEGGVGRRQREAAFGQMG